MKHSKIAFFLTALGFVACETEEVQNGSESLSAANNASLTASINLEASVEEVDDVLDDISMYSGHFFGIGESSYLSRDIERGRSGYFASCAEITVEETDDTKTVTLVFTGECEDDNGNAITGTVTKVETVTDTSSENAVTVEDFNINGYLVNGSKTFSWVENNANGNPEMTGTVDLSVEGEDGTTTKTGSKSVEITEGGDTYDWQDDVKTINGSFEYVGIDSSLNVEITTSLVKPASCRYIVSGVKTYTDADGTTTLDYGDGTCDNTATSTLPDGTVEEISLGRRGGMPHHDNDDEEDDEEDEDDDEDEEGDDENDDQDDEGETGGRPEGCVLVTGCGEIELDNLADLTLDVEIVDGERVITITDADGEVVFETSCSQDGEIYIECDSEDTEG